MKKFVISFMVMVLTGAIAGEAIAAGFYDNIADTITIHKEKAKEETVLAGPWKQLEEILRQFSYANQALLRVGCTSQQLNVEDNFWMYENKNPKFPCF